MARWIVCGAEFIEADIIRWTEGVWIERRKKKVRIADRKVMGSVDLIDGEWCFITVKSCEVGNVEVGKRVVPWPVGSQLKRRCATIGRGGAERYQWGGTDGEGAREILMRDFQRASSR